MSFMSAAEINKAIASITVRGKKLDADIQACGLSVLNHATAHGDTTLADKLVNALPKGARKLALVEWMLAFGQIAKLDGTNAADKQRIYAGSFFKLDRAKVLNIEGATKLPWYDCKPEKPVLEAFDAQAAVGQVLAKLTKASASGLAIENRASAIEAAQRLLATLEAGLAGNADIGDDAEPATVDAEEPLNNV